MSNYRSGGVSLDGKRKKKASVLKLNRSSQQKRGNKIKYLHSIQKSSRVK